MVRTPPQKADRIPSIDLDTSLPLSANFSGITMRRLMLLRHAEAGRPEGVGDHDRPLTPYGRKQGSEMGKYMPRQQLSPSLALISSARLEQETWELAYAIIRQEIEHRQEQRIYEEIGRAHV